MLVRQRRNRPPYHACEIAAFEARLVFTNLILGTRFIQGSIHGRNSFQCLSSDLKSTWVKW